jgi:hypothetical protein
LAPLDFPNNPETFEEALNTAVVDVQGAINRPRPDGAIAVVH